MAKLFSSIPAPGPVPLSSQHPQKIRNILASITHAKRLICHKITRYRIRNNTFGFYLSTHRLWLGFRPASGQRMTRLLHLNKFISLVTEKAKEPLCSPQQKVSKHKFNIAQATGPRLLHQKGSSINSSSLHTILRDTHVCTKSELVMV